MYKLRFTIIYILMLTLPTACRQSATTRRLIINNYINKNIIFLSRSIKNMIIVFLSNVKNNTLLHKITFQL